MVQRPPTTTSRPRTSDLAAAAIGFGIGALATGSADLPGDPYPAFNLLAGVGAAVLLHAWRGRLLAVFAALVVLGTLSPWAAGSSLVALFVLATQRELRVVLIAAAASMPTIPLAWLIAPDREMGFGASMLFGVPVFAAAVGWGAAVRARRESARRARNEEALHEERVRHDERERIAREMHDVLAHRLSLLSLHAGALEFRPDASREEVSRAAGVIRDAAHQALEELRMVIGTLRAPEGERASPEPPQPTLADLGRLLEETRAAGQEVHERVTLAHPEAVPAVLGRHAYRVVQEGLTNARKHAPSRTVDLLVDGRPGDVLRVAVRNPRTAEGSAIPGAGAGLTGLAERVELAGGRLLHGPDGDDFRLEAELPWPA